MNKQICPDCRKIVRNKIFLGTLHFCIREKTIKELDVEMIMSNEQKKAEQMIATKNPLLNDMGTL